MMKALKITTVREIIRLADGARAAHRSPRAADDANRSAAESTLALLYTAEDEALRGYLKSLSRDEMAELKALMWLGRNDCCEGRHDYPELVEFADEDPTSAVSYIAGKTPLADYLRAGLATLRRSG